MEYIKYHISVAAFFAKLAIKRQLEYPYFLICWLIGIPIHYLGSIWMINVITERFHALNGWEFSELAFLYGLSLLSHGMMVVLFIQTWNIEGMVQRGGFDRMLMRPMNMLFQFSFNHINFIGLIDMIPGSIIFAYGCYAVGFKFTFFNIIKIILVFAGAVLIRASFFMITGSIAFWTKGSRSMVGLGLTLFEKTSMYPLSIYPNAIQMIFTFIMPFGFISFYPACDFLNKGGQVFSLGFSLLTPLVGAILALLAGIFFSTGLKRYESAGS